MKRKIVLVGAGSTSFGPSTLMDLFHSDILEGSLITLHDINEKYLGIVFDLVSAENDRLNHKFEIELTTDRSKAFKGANFIISSIEVGKRFELWKQDYEIPKKHGSKQILGECGGPGGTLHAFRIIPPIVDIVKEADKICPGAFFINFSNPLSRVCLAIKRSVRQLKFIGLCHQIGALNHHLPLMFNKNLEDLKIIPYGLNHFGFLMGLEDLKTGRDLMPQFNKQAMTYFKANEERFVFSSLTFEVYEKFGYFPYVGDNHLGEFLQFGYEFTKEQDMVDWIERTEKYGAAIFKKVMRYHARLKKGNYPRKSDLFNH
jgi:alpha-galactosidase